MNEDVKFDYLLSEIVRFCESVQNDFSKTIFEKFEPKIKPNLEDLTTTCLTYDLLLIFARLNFYHEMHTDELLNFMKHICKNTPLTKEQIIILCDRLGANENSMLNEIGYFAYGGVLIDVFFCVYDYIAPDERKCKELTDADGLANEVFNVPNIHEAALSFELAPIFMDMRRDCDNIREKYLNYK